MNQMRRQLSFMIPLRTYSEANLRQHWSCLQRRRREQRMITRVTTIHQLGPVRFGPQSVVTLCRVAPRGLDSDNLAASMKAVRDGVADGLGMDDRDSLLTWRYEQRKGAYAVLVRIEENCGGAK